MYLDPIIPTPTQTPALSPNAIQDVTALTEAIRTLPPLAVMALVIVAVILYIVLVARKKPGDSDPLNSQIQQSATLIKQLENDREERKDLLNRLFDRDKEREDRTIESIAALTAIQEASRVTLSKVEMIVVAFNERDKNSADMLKSFGDNVSRFTAEGSEPVQTIEKRVGELMTIAADILKATQRIEAKTDMIEAISTTVNDVKLAISTLHGVSEALEQKKTDSQDVKAVTVETQPGESAA